MKHIAELIGAIVGVTAWLAGVVLASGFWSTAIACVFPPWGW